MSLPSTERIKRLAHKHGYSLQMIREGNGPTLFRLDGPWHDTASRAIRQNPDLWPDEDGYHTRDATLRILEMMEAERDGN